MIVIIPKNFDDSYLYFVLGSIFFSIFSIIVIKNASKNIIEKEGESK